VNTHYDELDSKAREGGGGVVSEIINAEASVLE
jgi:hypothetical protein